MDGGRDLDGPLEIVKSSPIADTDARDADRVEVARTRGFETERFFKPERLGAELDRLLEVVRHHQCTRELLEHEGLRR